MKKKLMASLTGSLVVLLFASVSWAESHSAKAESGSAKKSDEGFVSLFDGKTLDGWIRCRENGEEVTPEESAFGVEDGTIRCSGKGKDYWLVVPGGEYGNCILRLEFKLTQETNSGVFLRAPELKDPAFKGFEVQIFDDWSEDLTKKYEPNKHSNGSIYDVLSPMLNMSKPIGEWNEMEILTKGSKVRVKLNGITIIWSDFAELTEPIGKFDFPYSAMPKEGYVGVQNHGHELWFRNIQVKKLD